MLTLGSLSVDDIALYNKTYAPLLLEVSKGKDYENKLKTLKIHFQKHTDELCAFILEPLVQCAGNMYMYKASFIDETIKLCKEFEVQVIFDEIATGFGPQELFLRWSNAS